MDKSLKDLSKAASTTSVEVSRVGVNAPLDYASENNDEPITRNTNPGRAIMTIIKRLSHLPPREIDKVIENEGLTVHERLAAQWLKRCLSMDKTSAGHYVATQELQNLLDRTLGKAHYNMNVGTESKSLHLIAMNEESIAALESFGH